MSMSRYAVSRDRVVALSAALAVGAAAAAVAVTAAPSQGLQSECGPTGEELRVAQAMLGCVHADRTPKGVDVKDRVSTGKLNQRKGAQDAATDAVPAGTMTATSDSSSVTCDGDGQSGYRVQAMYVVEQGQPNRYADVSGSIQTWAAGVDAVFDSSAALTGGSRHVRYVTQTATDGTCVADVLNVTVPAGSMTSLSATANAVSTLGHNRSDRRYLMWTDANVLCGVANLSQDDRPGAENLNNGNRPAYARIDNGCWGLGSAGQGSIEAHELAHTLGGVQRTAPNATTAGHCRDESDNLCYPDTTGVQMLEVCESELEVLLDCNSDDYFSTAPAEGSYLATHWNVANSRFLIDGGALDAMTAPTINGTINRNDVGYGAPVAVTGSLVSATGAPAPGIRVSVKMLTSAGSLSHLGSASTAADGSISLTVNPVENGELVLTTIGTPDLAGAQHSLGQVTVGSWTPSLQFNATKRGKVYEFSGSVTRSYLGERSSAAQVPVDVILVSSGGAATRIATAITTSTGSFTASVNADVVGTSGSLQAVVQGVDGYLNGASAPVKLGRK